MSKLIVALDFSDMRQATTMAGIVVDEVAGFKVGLELLNAVGPDAIERIGALGRPVFADAKLHDIPNTVERAAGRIASVGARWVSVHASGGVAMLEAADRGMGGSGVLAVTILTSMDDDELKSVGVRHGIEAQAVALARLATAAGVEGLVCAPGDVAAIRSNGVGLTVFTPGIRTETEDHHDQRRVGTPRQAVDAGSDYLVIGRPITRATDPLKTAREIAASLTANI